MYTRNIQKTSNKKTYLPPREPQQIESRKIITGWIKRIKALQPFVKGNRKSLRV